MSIVYQFTSKDQRLRRNSWIGTTDDVEGDNIIYRQGTSHHQPGQIISAHRVDKLIQAYLSLPPGEQDLRLSPWRSRAMTQIMLDLRLTLVEQNGQTTYEERPNDSDDVLTRTQEEVSTLLQTLFREYDSHSYTCSDGIPLGDMIQIEEITKKDVDLGKFYGLVHHPETGKFIGLREEKLSYNTIVDHSSEYHFVVSASFNADDGEEYPALVETRCEFNSPRSVEENIKGAYILKDGHWEQFQPGSEGFGGFARNRQFRYKGDRIGSHYLGPRKPLAPKGSLVGEHTPLLTTSD